MWVLPNFLAISAKINIVGLSETKTADKFVGRILLKITGRGL